MIFRDLKAKWRFVIAVIILGMLMTGPFLLTSVLIWLGASPGMRDVLIEHLLPQIPLGGALTALGFIVGLLLVRRLFNRYVTGMAAMVEQLRMMLGSNRSFRIVEEGPPELRELVRAINDLASQRDTYIDDVEAQVAKAKGVIEEEKNRLAALMSELAQAVVVCNLEGRILLYNNRARFMFESLATGPTSVNRGALIGLGRSISSILDPSHIAYAKDSIKMQLERGTRHAAANFVTTSEGGQLVRVQVSPVLKTQVNDEVAAEASGYILLVENITRVLEEDSRRDQALGALTEGSRASLGSLRAAVETLTDNPDMPTEMHDRFVAGMAVEVRKMSQRLDETLQQLSLNQQQAWPLDDMLVDDIVAVARNQILKKLDFDLMAQIDVPASYWVRADSFALVSAITFLVNRLQEVADARSLRLQIDADDRFVHMDLVWDGLPLSSETVLSWELETVKTENAINPPNLRDILNRHGAEMWYQRTRVTEEARIRILLPRVMPDASLIQSAAFEESDARPEYYDFNLFERGFENVDLDQSLSALMYTVFDTETTGLEPLNDEIIQVGAVRILNGRILNQEYFDELIDPRIPLKAASIAIHGITESMLLGKPTCDLVLPAFEKFCSDTVLVGHNVAFDMRFLSIKERQIGIRFDHPVLDTLMLSAVAAPNQTSHSLEAIMDRLGVSMGKRHNALADATATAEVFIKLIPLLAEQGVTTLGQAIDASQKTYYAKLKY